MVKYLLGQRGKETCVRCERGREGREQQWVDRSQAPRPSATQPPGPKPCRIQQALKAPSTPESPLASGRHGGSACTEVLVEPPPRVDLQGPTAGGHPGAWPRKVIS